MSEWTKDLAAEMWARNAKAVQMVGDLCEPRFAKAHRSWTMSIPARPDYDPDIVIADSLKDLPEALNEIARLQAESASRLALAKELAQGLVEHLDHAMGACADQRDPEMCWHCDILARPEVAALLKESA